MKGVVMLLKFGQLGFFPPHLLLIVMLPTLVPLFLHIISIVLPLPKVIQLFIATHVLLWFGPVCC